MLGRLEIKRGKVIRRGFANGVSPRRIDRTVDSKPATIQYSNGTNSLAACLRCADAPCMRLGEKELEIGFFRDFPGEKSNAVCPTDAIAWNESGDEGPRVDKEACFGCGLCVSRCPVGAMFLDKAAKAIVADKATAQIVPMEDAKAEKSLEIVRGLGISGRLFEFDASRADEVNRSLGVCLERGKSSLPNKISRNLLIGLGWNASARRTGDTHVRMDLVAQLKGQIVVGEVELTNAAIDTPRNILDDIAVLASRHGVDKGKISGLVVSKELPNQRSEYWRVISDVEKVLHVRISTVSVLSLVMLIWEGKGLDKLPFANEEKPEIRTDIQKLLGKKVGLPMGYLSILETPK